MAERGIEVDASTIYRWVQPYAPEPDQPILRKPKPTRGGWQVDETYIRIKRLVRPGLGFKNFSFIEDLSGVVA